jgi:TDG/mug DNA glycosylase family protein
MKLSRWGTVTVTSISNNPVFYLDLLSMAHASTDTILFPDVGLLPVIGKAPEVLICGSFPSLQSLVRKEYYGNPRNHFWRIMEFLFGIDHHLPYAIRTSQLTRHRIALWDVISSCYRKGSADNRIQNPVFNDLAGFLAAHPTLRLVVLNGTVAGRYYHQLDPPETIPATILPSTSPANTYFTFFKKADCWKIIVNRTHPD